MVFWLDKIAHASIFTQTSCHGDSKSCIIHSL